MKGGTTNYLHFSDQLLSDLHGVLKLWRNPPITRSGIVFGIEAAQLAQAAGEDFRNSPRQDVNRIFGSCPTCPVRCFTFLRIVLSEL